MRLLLAELAPRRGATDANLDRIAASLVGRRVDVAVFPELFVTGYALGDRVHRLALAADGPEMDRLDAIARDARTALVVGAPRASSERVGEVENVALAVAPGGDRHHRAKRYLPTYGPFEEGQFFSPAARSDPVPLAGHAVGLAICYDAFFPEVFRALALGGADLLILLSASPVTSRRLFERILPARAIENATPLVFVNRTGVEDGIVFGGGSGAWDARGEPIPLEERPGAAAGPGEHLFEVEIDLSAIRGWRPFRPVLRDAAARPESPGAAGTAPELRFQPRP